MNQVEYINEVGNNATKLRCKVNGCNSLILLANKGKLIQDILPEKYPHIENKDKYYQFKLKTVMDFENVAVSKLIDEKKGDGMKFLACADCEKGPIGYLTGEGIPYINAEDVKYD